MTKQKETNRRHRLSRDPKSLEAVLAYAARIEASLPTIPPAVQDYLRRVREWAISRRNERVKRNMGLVGKCVFHRYRVALDSARVNLDDAMQEGAMGLMHGAELFDESRGVLFSTYAVRWICQRIGVLLDNASLIHAPKHLFHEKGTKYPTDHFKEKYKDKAARSRCISSLSTCFPPNLQGDLSGEATVEEPRADVPCARIDASIDLEPLLIALHPRQRLVIELRFFNGLHLDEVGAELARQEGVRVTRERVRQIVAQALARMRAAAKGRE